MLALDGSPTSTAGTAKDAKLEASWGFLNSCVGEAAGYTATASTPLEPWPEAE